MAKKEDKKTRLTVLVAHGVNLDLLGQREADHYGAQTLKDVNAKIEAWGKKLAAAVGCELVIEFFQSNEEAAFLQQLSAKKWDGIVINPGAWTHTSLALADRLKALGIPYVETHLSNIAARESFRHFSYSAPHAQGVIFGLGGESYLAALTGLVLKLS